MITIFAYGSNMNFNRLKERTPSAKKIATVLLPHYRFVCNKLSTTDGSAKGNIMPDARGTGVWGVLYDISDAEKPALDRAEGIGYGYTELTVTVFDAGMNSYSAVAYVADNSAIREAIKPFDWYKEYIVTGARENNLPATYVQHLEAIDSTVDPDTARREKHFNRIRQ